MERLTKKELVPYLPYKLEVKGFPYSGLPKEEKNVFPLKGILKGLNGENAIILFQDNNGHNWDSTINVTFSDFKPLLRPISSINLKWFQDNIDEALEDFRINCEPENNHFSVEVCEKGLGWFALSLEEYQLFYENHVDIHSLIDRGLALPIEGKEV